MRMMGALVMFLGTSCFGFTAALHVRKEVKILQQLKQSLEIMRCEISYTMTPFGKLCELLCRSTQGEVRDFYAQLKTSTETGEENPSKLVRQHFPMLSEMTAEALCALTGSFGRFGVTEQLRLVDASIMQVEQELAGISEERQHRAKCYRTLGVCTGLAIAILVL